MEIIKERVFGGMVLNKNVIILTNNGFIVEKYSSVLDIKFIDGQYIDVLKAVRDNVHKGAKLITHPLMGSIKPNETPYRSIIISEGHGLDVESLAIIESSIAAAEKFQKDNKIPVWSEKILEDFRFVDLKLFESALDSAIR